MATYEEVINGNINSLRELKELIRQFKDELATAKEGSKEWEDACEGLAVAQERVDKIQRAAKGTLEGYNKSAKDSINTLKQQIKELNTQRNAMDMNSQEYLDATEKLKEMNTRLRESGVAAGDMRANVGNYAQSLAAGFEGVKTAVSDASSQMISAISGLGQSMGALSPTLGTVTTGLKGITAAAGPVALALAAIAAVLAAFKEGVQSSEENTNKFKEALAPVEAVLVIIQRAIQEATSKVLDWMIAIRENEKVMNALKIAAQVIVAIFLQVKTRIENLIDVFSRWYDKVKEVAGKIASVMKPVTDAISNVYNTVMQKLQPAINWIVDKWNLLAKTDVGKLLGLKEIGEASKEWEQAGEIVEEFTDTVVETETKIKKTLKEEIDLQKSKRDLLVANARLNGEIAQKDLEINEERNKEVKDYDKILGLINEKTELQIEQAKNNVALKEQELAIIRKRNALADSNTKDLDAEAQAYAALIEAENALTQARARGEKEQERILNAKRTEARTKATNELTAALKELEAQYTNTLSAIEKPLAPEGAEIDENSINAYHDQMLANYQAEYDAYAEMTKKKIEALEAFISTQKAAGYETAEQEAEIMKLRAKQQEQYKKLLEAQNAEEKTRTKQLRSNYATQLGAFSNLMGSMQSLFEENTVAYKVAGTAKAIIDTFVAANAVLAEQQGGMWARVAAMAATITAGIANVVAIWSTNTKSPSVPTSTAQAATAVPQIDETPYSYAQTVQTVAAEETINSVNEPVKVYVLESDITDAQNRSKVRVEESSF